MNLFIIGDVHGCYETLKKLVENHWDPENEVFVQLGDLIDRGNFSVDTVEYVQGIRDSHPDSTVLLRGNHEQEFIRHVELGNNMTWLMQGGDRTIKEFQEKGRDISAFAKWMKELPLSWENKHVFISHAGISRRTTNPFDTIDPEGILWTRSPLKNIGKVQVVGHTPMARGYARHDKSSNAWYIDTGAFMGRRLTALRLTAEGQLVDIVEQETEKVDFQSA